MMIPGKDQFSGCLIGQCLGDALGCPVEGFPHVVCKEYIHDILSLGGREKLTWEDTMFGQYTDDSQLARELLISYSQCRAFSPENYASRIASIFSEGKIVGGGRATWEAAMRLTHGTPWHDAGTPAPSAGNGSSMRAGPIGLIFFDDPQAMIKAAYDQGRITHKDPRCSAGAVAIAGAVALVLGEQTVNPETFLRTISSWTDQLDSSVSQAVRSLTHWIELTPDEAVGEMAQAGYLPGYSANNQGVSPFVTGSVLWSLYAFLHSPLQYLDTIYTAIEVGGDVDTTAAMAGAISGAYLGITGIPSDLVALVTDKGEWGYKNLIELAHTCHDIKSRQME